MTEADGIGEGDSPAVEKFELKGLLLGNGLLIGSGMSCCSIILTLAGFAAAAPVRAAAFVLAVVFVAVRAFVPTCVTAVELPLKPPSPLAAPLMIPPVGLLIPVCAPPFIPMCGATFVFGAVIVLLRKFCGAALAELPINPLCPSAAPVVAPLLLVPVRSVCVRLNGIVAKQIAITPSLIAAL